MAVTDIQNRAGVFFRNYHTARLRFFSLAFLHVFLTTTIFFQVYPENKKPSSGNPPDLVDSEDWTTNTGAQDTNKTLDDRLLAACISGDLTIVKQLIGKGANPATKDLFGRTPLMYAGRFGRAQVVKYLCSQKIGINEKRTFEFGWSETRRPFPEIEAGTALMESAINGDTSTARILLAAGADVMERNSLKNTALFYAVSEGNAAMVRLLLDNGAKVDSFNVGYETALSYAVRNGRNEIVEMLVADREKPGPGTLTGALCAAVDVNDSSLVIKLLCAGAPCDSMFPYSGHNRYSPLILAARLGRKEIAALLLHKGANVNLVVDGVTTALFEAVSASDTEMVRFLLKNGAKADVYLNRRPGLLYTAYSAGSLDIVKMILGRGVNFNDYRIFPNVFCDGDFSPEKQELLCYLLPVAAESLGINLHSPGFLDTMHNGLKVCPLRVEELSGLECLKQNGILIDYERLGITKLMVEASMGRVEGIKRELGEGTSSNIFREIKINESSKDGWNALSCAIINDRLETVRYLGENGADINPEPDSPSTILEQRELGIYKKRIPSPLGLALMRKKRDIVEYLMEKGAQLPVKSIGDMRDYNFLCYIFNGSKDDIPLLLALELAGYMDLFYKTAEKKDAALCSRDYQAAFLTAAVRGQVSVAEYLLKKFPALTTDLFDGDDSTGTCFGPCAFKMAADLGHIDILKLLIEKTHPPQGWRPLLPAALASAEQYGHTEVVNLLLRMAYGTGKR